MRSIAFLWYEHFLHIIVYFVHYFSSHNVSVNKQILTPFSTSLYIRFFIVYTSFDVNCIFRFLLFSLT